MELKYRLLDHPFYQSWSEGTVTKEQLAKYHKSYAEFIELMPQYWHKINKAFNQNTVEAAEIVQDEMSHIPLWADWSHKLPETEEFPRMSELIDSMNKMTPSELLGAVQAFETQQPEVAETKKAGLLKFYGFEENETKYFDEHMKEEEHIEYGNSLKEKFANQDEYKAGFEKGAELFYNGLNLFVTC
jgi:pyrroloquinoline-quinone synthase